MYEAGSPIVLAKDITIALIERNSMALSSDGAAEWAGKTYETILDAIMKAANKPKPK